MLSQQGGGRCIQINSQDAGTARPTYTTSLLAAAVYDSLAVPTSSPL